jgi:hypothetical protein
VIRSTTLVDAKVERSGKLLKQHVSSVFHHVGPFGQADEVGMSAYSRRVMKVVHVRRKTGSEISRDGQECSHVVLLSKVHVESLVLILQAGTASFGAFNRDDGVQCGKGEENRCDEVKGLECQGLSVFSIPLLGRPFFLRDEATLGITDRRGSRPFDHGKGPKGLSLVSVYLLCYDWSFLLTTSY